MSNRPKFSPAQEKAIYETIGKNYLVSAGAGSGKTAVLTERIYHLAKQEKTLKCFLVLTFTKLAAGEMKSRVRNKLLEDKETIFMASQVDNAHIETFDSFTLFLTQKYSYALNLPSDLSVIDSNILTIKRHKIIDEIFTKHYANNDQKFVDLMKEYCRKDDQIIKEFLLKITSSADKEKNKYEFLLHLKNDFYKNDNVKLALNDYVNEIHENINFLINKISENGLEDSNDETQILAYLDGALQQKTYDSLREYLTEIDFPRKDGKVKTNDGEYRNAIADFVKTKIKPEKSVNYGDEKFISEAYLNQKDLADEIIELAIEVEKELDEFKAEHNVYSYGDISRFALKLIENEEIRKDIASSFKYIMIDEYQDTNDVQETLISAIGKDNIYMVGDVKQSIYRFRGADCTIFQEKYNNYKQNNGGGEIDLNTSYRSRSEIVDFINDIFGDIMNKKINSIDYSNGHTFGFGQKIYEKNDAYKPEIYNYEYENKNKIIDTEIDIIINDINNKILNHFQVYDFKLGSLRDCDYKDFAIITDRKTQFVDIKAKFEENAIPIHAFDKEDLFRSDIVYLIKNLLKLFNCCLLSDYESSDFKHSFMSVARSFLFEYDDNKLHQIITQKTYLLEPFMQKIELIKEQLRFKSIKEIVARLYDEFNLYDSISKITQFYANAHKAETILNIANSLDLIEFTFGDFIEYFDQIAEINEEVEFKDSSSIDNSVTLINIHASKGLEYGIVYYSLMNKHFVKDKDKNTFILSNKYGLLLPYTSGSFNSIFIHLSNELNCKEDFEERIRQLYVALTRAKEKIVILNGNKLNGKEKIVREYHADCMSDILKLSKNIDTYSSLPPSKTNYVRNETKNTNNEKIILKEIHLDSIQVNKHRASKALDADVDQSLLEFGKLLHSCLENVDFEKKDTSFIKNKTIKKYVENVLNSKLFKNVKNEQIKKEFEFYDEQQNLQGFIDALIIKDNEIDIIDYKIKNISDEHYDEQLNSYKKYISKITNKPVKMYLLAASTGESREVYEHNI